MVAASGNCLARRGLGLLVAATALAAGCARTAAVRLDNPLPFSDTDPSTVEAVSRRVLEELRFRIETPQTLRGRLTTEPLTGASWFEFWRQDTLGRDQVTESSMHTTRRRAIVTISATAAGAEVAVEVVKERMSAPDVGPGTMAQVYSLYDLEHSELTRFDELEPSVFEWVERGRDDALEQRILVLIQRRLASGR